MYHYPSHINKDAIRKLEVIQNKRKELQDLKETLKDAQQRRQENPASERDAFTVAKARNAKLIKEVQQEMARLRTLKVSPLMAHLHQLSDNYLAS